MNELPLRLPKPAYKDKDKAQPKRHVIDQLVFDVAKGVRQRALRHFETHFDEAVPWDATLARVWKKENDDATGDPELTSVLKNMNIALHAMVDSWKLHVRVDKDDDERRPVRNPDATSFKALAEECREIFLSLCPSDDEIQHPVVKKWYEEWKATNRGGYWSLLKASALFNHHHRSSVVWYAAGVELGELKVTVRGRGTYRPVTGEIFNAFKLDSKAVARARRMAENEAGAEEEEDDEFGDLDWGSQWG